MSSEERFKEWLARINERVEADNLKGYEYSILCDRYL